MKIYIFLFVIVILQSCNLHDDIDNLRLIKKIDAFKEVKTVYEIEIDSLGLVVDTISILKYKNNEKGSRIFEERITLKGKNFLRVTMYYSDNGNLFYSKSQSSESGILSIYQSREVNDKIQNAVSYNYENNKVKDTIFMGYDYVYTENKTLDKLIISVKNDTVYGFEKVILYDKNEKPYQDLTLSKNDTISKVTYNYMKEQIVRKKIENYKDHSLVEISYNNKGHIMLEDFFIKKEDILKKVESTMYFTEDNGDLLKKTIISYYPLGKKDIIYKSLID